LHRAARERPGFGISRLDRRASAYRELECHGRSFLATADVDGSCYWVARFRISKDGPLEKDFSDDYLKRFGDRF